MRAPCKMCGGSGRALSVLAINGDGSVEGARPSRCFCQPKRKKPTRRDLLIVIERLQVLIGDAASAHGNDRDPNGFEKGQRMLTEAHDLCVEARGYDPPLDGKTSRGGWRDG